MEDVQRETLSMRDEGHVVLRGRAEARWRCNTRAPFLWNANFDEDIELPSKNVAKAGTRIQWFQWVEEGPEDRLLDVSPVARGGEA